MSIHHAWRQGERVEKPSTLALAKFSYATTSTERVAPVNWTHIAGDTGLFVVFERVRICGASTQNTSERRLLKVQKGLDTLEEVDLNSLVEEAAERAKSSQMHNPKLAVAVIVKPPCLAVRYPTQNTQVRRFQIKFSSESDYYKALAILSEVGCPITESAPGPHQPRISRSISTSSQISPSPSVSVNNYDNGPPTLPSFINQRPPTFSSVAEVQGLSRTSGSSKDLIGDEIRRKSFYEADNDDTRVSTVSSASSVTACEPRSDKHLDISLRSQAPGANPQTRFPANPELPPGEPELPHLQSRLPSSATLESPAIQSLESLDQALPPKRELPFVKPAAKKPRSSVQRTPRKAVSSSLTSPARSAASGSRINGPEGSHEVKTMRSAGKQDATEAEAVRLSQPQENNILSRPCSASKRPQTSQRTLEHHVLGSQPSLSTGNSHTTETFTTTEQIPSIVNNHDNSMNVLQDRPTPSLSAANNNNTSPTQPQATQPSNTTSVPEPRSAGTITTSDLSSYLQTPNSERSALVESWVCQQLQDDGFLALCEDVEGVWRRIALGR